MVDRGSVATTGRGWLLYAIAALAGLGALVTPATGVLAAAGHAIGGDRYEGRTNQGQATVLVVSASGTTVKALLTAITYDSLCGRHGGPPYHISSTRRIAIRPGGTFTLATKGTTAGPGSLTVLISGTFTGSTVRGTIVATGSRARCPKPKQHANPYSATFSAQGSPAASP